MGVHTSRHGRALAGSLGILGSWLYAASRRGEEAARRSDGGARGPATAATLVRFFAQGSVAATQTRGCAGGGRGLCDGAAGGYRWAVVAVTGRGASCSLLARRSWALRRLLCCFDQRSRLILKVASMTSRSCCRRATNQ